MATKKKTVCFYLEKINFDRLQSIVRPTEISMSRWLSQKIIKIIDAEIKKGETK
jgi:hypothetical protein